MTPNNLPPISGPSSDSQSEINSNFRDLGGLALLERVLRGREALFERIFKGKEVARFIRFFLVSILVLSACYGITMGMTGLASTPQRSLLQMLSSAAKVPMLYLMSLMVCYPMLFVINVLMGSKLSFAQSLAVVLLAVTLNSILLVSCAPSVLFFIVTGSSYDFIKLLHVVIFAISGGWAMLSLWQGLKAICEKSDLYPRQAIKILQVWVIVFGFVGVQMAWSLRPFVGAPGFEEFELFRSDQTGNFYQAVWSSVQSLGGDGVK